MVVPGARAVDIRNTSGGLSRFTTIPSSSMFRTYGGKGAPCTFTSPFGGTTSNGDTYLPNQLVESYRWIFIEGLPEALGEPTPSDPTASRGPLATAVRHFTVFCDSVYHFVAILDVPVSDPMLNPRSRLTTLYNGLQLEQPVVYRNPVVDRWGGLITRYPAWLAIVPSAWRAQRSNPAFWRGWTMYLLTDPAAMEFEVHFVPDPSQPSTPFNGVVSCIAMGSSPVADAVSMPAMPDLPVQTAPGINGPCMWTPAGPGSVTIQARITYHVTFWANGYTETLADYVWTSVPVTFRTGELAAVNTNG